MDKPNTENVMALAFELAETRQRFGPQHPDYRAQVIALRTEVERLAAQAAPSEAQADLVIAVHALASHFENTLYALRDDAEAVTKAKGDIAHALQISAKYNRNGAAAQPSQAPVVQAVQATQAVRMLTREELNDVALSDQVGWEPGEYIEAVQRKFCAVNAGRAIPPDGKIGGV